MVFGQNLIPQKTDAIKIAVSRGADWHNVSSIVPSREELCVRKGFVHIQGFRAHGVSMFVRSGLVFVLQIAVVSMSVLFPGFLHTRVGDPVKVN